MSDFELLIKSSGCRIYEKDKSIIVKKQHALWIPTGIFVLLIMSGIPLVFGVISLFTHFQGYATSTQTSLVFIVAGLIFGIMYVLLKRYSKKINSLKPEEYETLCSFDLKNKTLLDPSEKVLDTLENVFIKREFQFTSSSKKLVLHYSNGSITLAKGNPFTGGTAELEGFFKHYELMN